MKRSVLAALCAAAALAAAADPVPVASIRWINRDFDFGLMKEQAGPPAFLFGSMVISQPFTEFCP